MSLLIIALPQAHYTDQPLDFMLLADGDVVEAGQAAASALPRVQDRAHEVVALVPPRALSWHAVQLPPGVGAQSPRLSAVLEGLLEDELLDPPAELHLCLAGESLALDGGQTWVAACERRWLAMAVQGLEAAGCPPTRVLPEWGPPGELRVHVLGTAEHMDMVLCGPRSISLLPLDPEVLSWAQHEVEGQALALSAEPDLVDCAQAPLQRPVQAWRRSERWAAAARPRWDLSRGLQMRRRAQRSALEWLQAPRWRDARWAAGGLLVVNLLGFNALAWSQNMHLQTRRAQLQQMLQQTFAQAQPTTSEDAPRQMRRALERLRAASAQPIASDLPVMLSAVLPTLPAGHSPQALDYVDGQLRLKGLDLSAAALQALVGPMKARGYSLTLQGADLLVRAGP